MVKTIKPEKLLEIVEDWYQISHERPTEIKCNNKKKCKQAYQQIKKLVQGTINEDDIDECIQFANSHFADGGLPNTNRPYFDIWIKAFCKGWHIKLTE